MYSDYQQGKLLPSQEVDGGRVNVFGHFREGVATTFGEGKMSKVLTCPVCGSWYSNSNEAKSLGVFFSEGELCNNMTGQGPLPKAKDCSPEKPCQGRLIPAEK
jgi:hypothetical protein